MRYAWSLGAFVSTFHSRLVPFEAHFELPELGPIGSTGFANIRDLRFILLPAATTRM